jgi:methylmalonyl-CoA mutase
MKMAIHSRGSNWSQTIFDRHVNILRGTVETMAAALGGAESITTLPFDSAFGPTTDISRRIAVNTSTILSDEAGLARVLDPVGGSGYLEFLTEQIAKNAWAHFQFIESRGGMLASISEGGVQAAIAKEYAERKKSIDRRKEVFLGTTRYPNLTELNVETQTRTLNVGASYPFVVSTADGNNTFTGIVDAIHSGSDFASLFFPAEAVLKEVDRLPQHRGAEDFESIRQLVGQESRRPRVLLATFGPVLSRRARASFSAELLGIAGFEILDHPGYETIEAVVEAAAQSDADVVVLCSDDESYLSTGIELAEKIKKWKAKTIVLLAGNPGEHLDQFKRAGVDDCISVRTDACLFLNGLLSLLALSGTEVTK